MGLFSGKCFICGAYAPSKLKHGEWICGKCVKSLGGYLHWNRIRHMSGMEIDRLKNTKNNNLKRSTEFSSDGINEIASHLYVNQMDGIEYEHYCGERLKQAGAKRIEYTSATNDYGADIIAYFNDGTKWVVQCKRYSGKVGNSAVQEVVSAIPHYGADGAIIMTNSVLTANARILANDNGVWIFENIT